MGDFEENILREIPDEFEIQADADYCADMIKHVHDRAEVTRREQLCLDTLVKCREYIICEDNNFTDYFLLDEVEGAIKELKGGKQ